MQLPYNEEKLLLRDLYDFLLFPSIYLTLSLLLLGEMLSHVWTQYWYWFDNVRNHLQHDHQVETLIKDIEMFYQKQILEQFCWFALYRN